MLGVPVDKSVSNAVSVRETNRAIQWIVIYPVDTPFEQLGPGVLLYVLASSY